MRKTPDYWFMTLALVLAAMGIVMVFSASSVVACVSSEYNNDPLYFLKRQVLWTLLGLVAMVLAMRIDIHKLRKWAFPAVMLSIGMLGLVLSPHFGVVVNGARRWLHIGPISLQPAEFAKFGLLLYLADVLARRGTKIKHALRLIPLLLIFGAVVVLIEKEPDLGTAMVVAAMFFSVLWMSGAKFSHLASLAGLGVMATIMSIFKEQYRMDRMTAFLDPFKDAKGVGYHTVQSLIALGSGGVWGLGLGESRQKFLYLPEQYTDYIFAVLGEELGLIGTLAMILLFVCFLYKGFKIALDARQPFMTLLAAGGTAMICFQGALNIGVVAGALPSTGVPLPFISFGGSSLLLNMLCVGLMLNISSYKHSRRHHREHEGSESGLSKKSAESLGYTIAPKAYATGGPGKGWH
ncbi:MAG TPA: putative lipid II flippase FtsW [Candidatus Xenobia bacterium]|jgi:cell division protein FtsW